MSKYIDLVLVSYAEGRIPSLCKAPELSDLEKGDRVAYQWNDEEMNEEYEEMEGIVEASITIEEDDEVLDFIIKAVGSKPLHKILRKITYREFEYEEEES